jgi:GAF domain-containing protein
MYDPVVVDTFAVVRHTLDSAEVSGPCPAQPADTGPDIIPDAPMIPDAASDQGIPEIPMALPAAATITQFLEGRATIDALLELALADLSLRAPGATCALYVPEEDSGLLVARYAAGPAEEPVLGTSMAMGERLSGWVATSRDPVEKSDAALDLHDRNVRLGDALSLPLLEGNDLAGVLTAYSAAGREFTEEQRRLIQLAAPHLVRILASARHAPLLA